MLFVNFNESQGCTRKTAEEGMKRPWPEDIVMSDAVKELVSKRWKEYGL